MLFQGHFDSVPCIIMLDPGSGTDIMCSEFAKRHNINTSQTEAINLRYGDGRVSTTNQISTNKTVALGENIRFKEEFYINPHKLPGVDLILGMAFMNKFRAEIRYPDKIKGGQNLPFLYFPCGNKVYTKDNILSSGTVD